MTRHDDGINKKAADKRASWAQREDSARSAAAEEAIERHRLRQKALESGAKEEQEYREMDALFREFYRWAQVNGVKAKRGSFRVRGWLLFSRTETHVLSKGKWDEESDYTHQVWMTTTGRLVVVAWGSSSWWRHTHKSKKMARREVEMHGLASLQDAIARVVAESGKPWR